MKAFAWLVLTLVLGAMVQAQVARPLAANEILATGDIISFTSLDPAHAGAVLEGRKRTEELGTAGWRLGDAGRDSVTRWRVQELAKDIFAFQCLGLPDDPAWLDGYTPKGFVVLRLSPNGISGASWALYREGPGYNLRCLGRNTGARWLTLGPQNSVVLSQTPETAASRWQVMVWRKIPSAESRAR